MTLFLILLAAGDSKRLKSNTPKPYNKVNNKTLLEHSLDAFQNFSKIKKITGIKNEKMYLISTDTKNIPYIDIYENN